jgi:hypothetical protein
MASRNERSKRIARSSRLSLSERLAATWAGYRDGRKGWPCLPQDTPDGPLSPLEPNYCRKLTFMVQEAADQCLADLFENSRLPVEILLAANAVVDNESSGKLTSSHKNRLTTALMTWATRVQVRKARVTAAVARANQLLAHYWDVAKRHHIRLRGDDAPELRAWRPSDITLNQPWPEKPLELLKRWTIEHGDPDAKQYGVLLRALEIVNG